MIFEIDKRIFFSDTATILLKRLKANPNLQNLAGDTPLHKAVEANQLALIKLLMEVCSPFFFFVISFFSLLFFTNEDKKKKLKRSTLLNVSVFFVCSVERNQTFQTKRKRNPLMSVKVKMPAKC
jgi:ankyrin repeat protein